MKVRFTGTGALSLALIATSQFTAFGAATNGLIVISSRTASDALYRQISSSTLYDADDFKGPGVFSPGDAAMAELLQDHGYSTRLVPEWLLHPFLADPQSLYSGMLPEYFGIAPDSPGSAPDWIYGGAGGPTKTADTNEAYSASLVIVSGSGSSFDMPPPNTRGIGIVMGEHSCMGDRSLNGKSSIYMYSSINPNSGDAAGNALGDIQYMQVVNPTHMIMQGIPLDANGRVKIWRDAYPEEDAHVPAAGKSNYRYSWLTVNIDPALAAPAVPAPGTTILGVLGTETNKVVFAVMDIGGEFGLSIPEGPWTGRTTSPSRLVHLFVNERGSGDSRRAFNCLTDLGKVIFIRACKWAMGETLAPYQPLGLIRVSKVGEQQIRLEWDGTATKNYKVQGTRNPLGPSNLSNWQTVAQDIHGTNGPVSITLDVSGATQYAFLRVVPVP